MAINGRGNSAWLLLLMFLLCSVAAIAFTALQIASDRETYLSHAAARTRLLAVAVEERARRTLDLGRGALDDIAETLDDSDPLAVGEALRERMRHWLGGAPQFSSFWVFDAQGRNVFNSLGADAAATNYADRPYFQAHAAGQALYLGELTEGRRLGHWFFSLSKRLVARDGRFKGVLLLALRADDVAGMADALGLESSDNVAMFRRDGAALARWLPPGLHGRAPSATGHPVFRSLAAQPAGIFEGPSVIGDGVVRVGAYRAVVGWPAVVVAGSDEKAELAGWRARSLRAAAFCFLVIMAIGAVCAWGYRKWRAAELARDRNAMLLNEVHHRVKNNLAIVQSLLLLEAHQAPPEARRGYEESIERLQAIALVHQQLYQDEVFDGVNAAQYLMRLCKGLQPTAGAVRLRVVAEGVQVQLDDAVPMALIVTELVTNAVKHAFAGPPAEGKRHEVTVRLARQGKMAVLQVADNGRGLPEGFDLAMRQGLGLTLVRQLTRQLGGTMRVAGAGGRAAAGEATGGCLFEVSFPLRQAQEPAAAGVPAAG